MHLEPGLVKKTELLRAKVAQLFSEFASQLKCEIIYWNNIAGKLNMNQCVCSSAGLMKSTI